MPLAPGNSPYRLSKLQFSCTITTTWLSLCSPTVLVAGTAIVVGLAMTMGAAVADAGAAGGGAAVEDAACGLPPQAARMGSKSASSSSGEKMFHRVRRFIRLFLSIIVSKYSDIEAVPLLRVLAPDAGRSASSARRRCTARPTRR